MLNEIPYIFYLLVLLILIWPSFVFKNKKNFFTNFLIWIFIFIIIILLYNYFTY